MGLQLSEAQLVAVLLAAVRTAAWLMVAPPFNTRMVPAQAKALLSVAVAVPIAPGLIGQAPSTKDALFIFAVVQQVVVGAALGYLTALFFAAVQAAGSLIDLFGGFSVAFAFDPLSMTGNSVFGRFYSLLATALLFVTDGHALMLRGFATSFRGIPLGGTLSMTTLSHLITDGIGLMFLAALQIAGPMVAVLFCADVALGLLTRVAPSLNVFALAFPVKILLTLGIAGATLTLLPRAFGSLVEHMVRALLQAVGAG